MKKCPNCGAPVSGRQCAYCGQEFGAPPAPPEQPAQTEQAAPGRLGFLDIVLIILGSSWIVLVAAAAIELRYWKELNEIISVLLLMSPGILLIQFGRRKRRR